MNSTRDSKTISRLLTQLFPRPIGWLQSERDMSREKFVKIIGGLVAAALLTGVSGFCLMYFPEYSRAIWILQLFCLATLLGFVFAALHQV